MADRPLAFDLVHSGPCSEVCDRFAELFGHPTPTFLAEHIPRDIPSVTTTLRPGQYTQVRSVVVWAGDDG